MIEPFQAKYFKRSEFACACCHMAPIAPPLVLILDWMREDYDIPLKVSSGYRCSKHNAAIGGAKNSYHMKGLAADIHPQVEDVRAFQEKIAGRKVVYEECGLILYNGWFHLDYRSRCPFHPRPAYFEDRRT